MRCAQPWSRAAMRNRPEPRRPGCPVTRPSAMGWVAPRPGCRSSSLWLGEFCFNRWCFCSWAWASCCGTRASWSAAGSFGSECTRGLGLPRIGLGRGPTLGVSLGEVGTHGPCSPEPDRVTGEGHAEEGSGGGERLCADSRVGISLNLREQVLIYNRDRQLVVLNSACEQKFYVFHGVDII